MNIDIVDLFRHVAPSYLQKRQYVRTTCMGSFLNAILILIELTIKYADFLDFAIEGIFFDGFDENFARRNGEKPESQLFCIKAAMHHLKANNDHLTLVVRQKGLPRIPKRGEI